VLAAPRDGYTIALVVPATMITLPLTNPAFKIKPLQDFVPITAAVNTAATLIVSKDLGVKTLEEFAAYGRKHPGAMSYGVPGGAGTSFHFNSVIMAGKLGIEAAYVPYPGEVQAFNDVAGGRLQYALVSSTMRPQIESGKVVPLAVAGRKRDTHMKQVPTFREKGIDFTSDGWVGYAVASGTPLPVVARLSEAFVKALHTPAVQERLAGLGLDVVGNTPAQFQAAIQASTERYGALLRTGAVKIEN
jgi:tripartite-type tricarboxylate transporter receptor subunit TctC